MSALKQRIRILREGKDVSAAKFIANQLEYYLLLTNVDIQDRKIVEKYAEVVNNYELLFQKDVLSDIEQQVLPVLQKQEGAEYGIEEIGNPLERIESRSREEHYRFLEALKEKSEFKLLGLYIEDDISNVMVQQARFDLFEGISIKGLEVLPDKVEDFYSVIIKDNIDFLIIDHELDKQKVSYKGSDALNEIRKYDSAIYAILLNNYPLEEYKEELGAYDYQLTKSKMKEAGKLMKLFRKSREPVN